MPDSIQQIDFPSLMALPMTASPSAWEDQVLYFLLVDRFSDNREQGFAAGGTTSVYTVSDNGNAVQNEQDAKAWRDAGNTWANGKISGIINKLNYLKALGITAIWVSPVFQQVAFRDTYHGYGIQHFLQIDSHFGNLEEMQDLVKKAHALGIYVILDIIANHAGEIFSYDPDRYPVTSNGQTFMDARWDGNTYKVKGFNDAGGQPSISFTSQVVCAPNEAVWPVELRDPASFTQKGSITNMDWIPEYSEGDFFSLKDIHHGQGDIDNYQASPALDILIEVYKYWISVLDIDGYRVDTVKHMDPGAMRIFASAIHEYTQRIGKDNFYLIGEITGGHEFVYKRLDETGIDAALGIDGVQQMLDDMAKGKTNPINYFNLFRNSALIGKESHTWFRNKVVVMLDDHDKIYQDKHKARFCANDDGDKLILNAIAANLTTIGIPCIYYGTEQAFDGKGDLDFADRYIREAMFGGTFGAFRSKGRHFFDSNHFLYKEIAKITALRSILIPLRRGRQYFRDISPDGVQFNFPVMTANTSKLNSIIAWSRIMDDEEVVMAMNTDINNNLSAWITIDASLNKSNEVYKCIYPDQLVPEETMVNDKNGKAIFITVPPANFSIWIKKK